MNRLPPKAIRRVLLAPLVLVACLLLLVISPLLLLAAVIADLFLPGRAQALRLTGLALVYLIYEALGIVILFCLWVVGGFGLFLHTEPIQAAHYTFVRLWTGGLYRAAAWFLKLQITIEDPPERRAGPVLVFSRHGGPGDSILLTNRLMAGFGRRPRVVMLAKLQWEPVFDIVGNRLPNRFITHDPQRKTRYLEAIGELATGLGPRDALLLFPEGGQFSERRRLRAIWKLRQEGHEDSAEKATDIRNLMPPHPGGVSEAISHAPDADVVFVAHTGLENLHSPLELWRALPLDRPIMGRYWRIPPSEVPPEGQARIDWLFGWWATIDAWVAAHRVEAADHQPDPTS